MLMNLSKEDFLLGRAYLSTGSFPPNLRHPLNPVIRSKILHRSTPESAAIDNFTAGLITTGMKWFKRSAAAKDPWAGSAIRGTSMLLPRECGDLMRVKKTHIREEPEFFAFSRIFLGQKTAKNPAR